MKNSKIGKVFGAIHETKTNQPIEFATIAVLAVRDSSVAGGALTDGKGKFQIEELPFGRFKLRISFIGYKTFDTQPFVITPQSLMQDFGIISINSSAEKLKEVEVTAEKIEYTNSIDKKVYNLDKNIVNSGGTATDVLQNIPSVTVDIDGNVALRGSSNVTVLIDGKPSGLTGANRQAILQQLPANAIEQIELITNPSAKYDAEGMAGIINIKTKKEKLKGLNGNATIGAGTGDKYNASVALNNRTSHTNVFANYSYRSERRKLSSAGTQNYTIPALDTLSYSINGNAINQSYFHTAKLGSDFYLNNYNTLTLSGSYSVRDEWRKENRDYLLTKSKSFSHKYNWSDEPNQTIEANIDYKRNFLNSKRELTASANISHNLGEQANEYTSSLIDLGGYPFQTNMGKQKFLTSVAQVDYVHPLKNSKIETGIKGTVRNNDNLLNAWRYNTAIATYLNDPLYADHFIYNEQVYAAYLQYAGKLKAWDYSAGLRGEEALTKGDSKTKQTTFSNNYLALFPSAAIKYTLNTINEIQLGYSRRVNRPNTQALNPFIDYSDSLNLRSGNPYLKPEYIHALELVFNRTLEKWSISSTLYFRHTDNLISRYRTVNLSTGIATITQRNFSSSDNTGIEQVIRYQLGKMGSVMASFNLYQNKINASNIEADLQSTSTNWNARMIVNIRVAKTTSLQVTGMYMAPNKMPQSTIKQMMSGVDAGIKQDFWKSKASVSLNVTDIFDTRKFVYVNSGDGYVYNGFRKRESRIATLTFAYRFGSQDANIFQRKKNQKDTQPGDGGGDGGF